jgi:hypothetical protein
MKSVKALICSKVRDAGSDHLPVIAEEVSRVAELCIGQGNPTRFRGVRVGFDVAIKTGASDSEAYCCAMAVSSEVVEDIAKCYACFILSSVPLELTVGQNDFRPKP